VSGNPQGFPFEIPLKEGDNLFRLLARDEAGNVGEKTVKLVYEVPLAPTITDPQQGSTLTTDKIDVKGNVKEPGGTQVRVS
jgi:hypothetical protein